MYTRDWNGPGSHGGLGNNFDSILDNEELDYVVSDIENAYIEGEANDVNEKCVICLENTLTIAMKGCGHLVSCHACASKLQKECPICRAPNIGTMKIYFP